MGNSEVGHLTIGAGRVIYQDVMRISKAIETGAFARNEVLLDAIRRARDSARTLHLWGLLSDASVHSHIDHLFALLELAAGEGLREIAVHAVLDGRDTPPRSALPYRRRAGGEAQGARMRQGGDGQRTLLCDGSRQAMGARGARLARDRARRGNRRKQRARGGRTLHTPPMSPTSSSSRA